MKSITFSIAGFIITIQSDDISQLAIEEGYLPFVISDYAGKPDVTIHSKGKIPKELTIIEDVIFEARDQNNKFYTICKKGDAYKFFIYNQTTNDEIQQIALLNNDFSEWVVYSVPSDSTGDVYPMQYPLGPIVLYYLTVKFDAIMVHASGIDNANGGMIFSGFSSAGKSTMAALWQQTGSAIINDDRLIIRKENEDYVIHNTPMFYMDKPKKTILKAIHLIHHSPENTMAKINGALAISRVMAFCIQNNYKAEFINHHLAFLSGLCSKVPVYEVGFKPDTEIVDYIKSHVI